MGFGPDFCGSRQTPLSSLAAEGSEFPLGVGSLTLDETPGHFPNVLEIIRRSFKAVVLQSSK
jgi:hypothetical protein